MTPEQLSDLVARLRAVGTDDAPVEVKSAAGGMPESIPESLCALANLPGGGVLILGLSETDGFRPVPLEDPNALKQGLANRARNLQPPAVLSISDGIVDDSPVIVAEVRECPADAKPCRIASTGRAYLRSHDGDYVMTDLEIQGFMRARSAPLADRMAVPGTTTDDLDTELVASWRAAVPEFLPRLASFKGDEQLRRAGVVTPEGALTRAGLLMLGTYPQQHFPQFVFRIADLRYSGVEGERVRNLMVLDGAIPRMLSGAMEWMVAHLGHRAVEDATGHLHEAWDYPLIALRELIGNALVHRDVDHWSEGMAVEMRLERDCLTLTNPGGLYGTTLDRLGIERQSSARNASLFLVGQAARYPNDPGRRVVEAIASGLPRVAEALREQGLPAPQYFDQGVRFTVKLHRMGEASTLSRRPTVPESGSKSRPRAGTDLARVHAYLRNTPGGKTVAEVAQSLGLTSGSARRALSRLRDEFGLATLVGGRGKPDSRWYAVDDTAN